MTSNEENIPAKEEKKTKTARFYEKDVHLRWQKSFKSQEKKRTQ